MVFETSQRVDHLYTVIGTKRWARSLYQSSRQDNELRVTFKYHELAWYVVGRGKTRKNLFFVFFR